MERVKAVMETRRQYVEDLNAALLQVSTYAAVIARNLNAMNALDQQDGTSLKPLDPKAMSFLAEMKQQASDRLLRYHYYMVKAYEYRRLEKYPGGQMNLDPLYGQLMDGAKSATTLPGEIMSQGTRDLLKNTLRAAMASATDSIMTSAIANRAGQTGYRNYTFTADQLARINRGEEVLLNLVDSGRFLSNEDDIRIAKIEVFPGGVAPNPGDPVGMATTGATSGFVKINIEHSGISRLKSLGKIYEFRHYNKDTASNGRIAWVSEFDANHQSLTQSAQRSYTDGIDPATSILQSLATGGFTGNLALYSRPAAWADLKISREGTDNITPFGKGTTNPPITITRLELRISYELETRPETPAVKTVEVVTSVPPATGLVPEAKREMLPDYEVSRPDRNDRKDGTGRFTRIYNTSSTPFTITAPATYGGYGFLNWAKPDGTSLGTNPTLTVTPNADSKLMAVYQYLIPITPAITARVANVEDGFFYSIGTSNYNYPINTPWTWSATDTPVGLSVTPYSNIVAGKLWLAGSYTLKINASNQYGVGNVSTMALTVNGSDSFDQVVTLPNASGTYTAPSYPTAVEKWFTWTAPSNGIVVFDTAGTTFTAQLEAWEGNTRTTLKPLTKNFTFNGQTVLGNKISFTAVQGKTYRLAFDGLTASDVNAAAGFKINYSMFTADYTVVSGGNILTITNNFGANDVLTLSQPASGQLSIGAPGRTFSVNGASNTTGSSGTVAVGTIKQIKVQGGAGNDTINIGPIDACPTLIINGGAGDDVVTFTGNITFVENGNLDVNLQDDTAAPGTDQIHLASYANLVTSGQGSLTLKCSRSVTLDGGASLHTTDGALTIEANQQAVPTTGGFNGITISNATVESGNGTLTLLGRGGNGDYVRGVDVNSGAVVKGQTKVIVTGTSGVGTDYGDWGVRVDGVGTLIQGVQDIVVTGEGATNGSGNGVGVSVLAGGKIRGNKLEVNALGMGGPGSSSNWGVEIAGSGSNIIATETLDIGCSGVNSTGLVVNDSSSIIGKSAVIHADNMALDHTVFLNGVESLTLTPLSANTRVHLGENDAANVLGITSEKLDRMGSSKIIVADYSGEVQMTSQVDAPINLEVRAPQGWRLPGAAATVSTSVDYGFAADGRMFVPITSTTPGVGYPQLKVYGTVKLSDSFGDTNPGIDLTGTTLAGASGDQFTLIDNDGTDPVEGTFAGLPEGATLPWPNSPYLEARISYAGGSGNDVVLTLQSSTSIGYTQWASQYVPAGASTDFDAVTGDDGISNGIKYVFGSAPPQMLSKGVITAPPAVPFDAWIVLQWSTDLTNWDDVVFWSGGGRPQIRTEQISIDGDTVIDNVEGPSGFYRYVVRPVK